jgi:iron complex transport system substrate-binding protein
MRNLLLFFALFLAHAAAHAGPPAKECPRIVSQSPYLTEVLIWLGRSDCIVGVSRYDHLKRPKTGGVADPDPQMLSRLKPDLVLTSTGTSVETLEMVLPEGSHSRRLGGFNSLADMFEMLHDVAVSSRAPAAEERLTLFERAVRGRIAVVPAVRRKILLISACSGDPYSFGRQHYIGDVFTQAGFVLLEDKPRIRHLRPDQPISDILSLVEQKQPDLVINFSRENAAACNAELGMLTTPVLHLRGENFFHPGPRLMDGLDELIQLLKKAKHD